MDTNRFWKKQYDKLEEQAAQWEEEVGLLIEAIEKFREKELTEQELYEIVNRVKTSV